MGIEIDLLAKYPRTKRDLNKRSESKSEDDRTIARQFGRDFFDGDRRYGYGGFSYFPRFWEPVVPTFRKHWKLTAESSILAVERDGPGLIKHARLRRDVEALRLLGHGNLAIVSGRNSALHHLLAHHGNDLTLRRKRDIRGLIHSTFVNGSIWSYGGSIVER